MKPLHAKRYPLHAKLVLFDWGGVLGHDHLHKAYYTQKLKKKMAAAHHKAGWGPASTGELSESYFWRALARGLGLPYREVMRLALKADYEEGAFELARKLKRKGHRIAILTNNLKSWFEPNAKGKIADFELVFNSAELGTRKPELQMYLIPMKKMGFKPGDTYLIDDKKRNTDAAEALGMHGIVFKSSEKLEKDLKKLRLL